MYNPYIVIPLVTYLIVHLFKFTHQAAKGNLDFRYLFLSGGMPSSHTATVTALATVTGILSGFSSALFGVTAVFSTIVIYDAFGVRRSSGNQGLVLNRLLEEVAESTKDKNLLKLHLQPVLGHSPAEVITGMATGLMMALIFTYKTWTPHAQFLSELPTYSEKLVLLGIFGGLVIGGIALRLFMTKTTVESYKMLRAMLWLGMLIFGLSGLVFAFAGFEDIKGWGSRAWSYIILVLFGGYFAFIW
ncbi:MAG: divergent PAP2 family protein, partial [Candidatus Saccharimonadales bacterium]